MNPSGHRAASSPTPGSPTSRCRRPTRTRRRRGCARAGGVVGEGARPRGDRRLPRGDRRPRRDRAACVERRPASAGCAAPISQGLGVCLRRDVGPRAWRSSARASPVPYERCVTASTRRAAVALRPGGEARARRGAARRGRAIRSATGPELLAAVDAWRARAAGPEEVDPRARRRASSPSSTRSTARHVVPHLPRGAARRCRAPTSRSCRSRTPGSRAR